MPVQCTCLTCGEPITGRPSRGERKFCSRECWRNRPLQPAADRFWAKVVKAGPIPEHRPELGPCWLWTGAHYADGRPEFWYEGRDVHAAVVAYILTYGPMPAERSWALHHCDNLACVRPDHVYAGTAAQNATDMMERGRHYTQTEQGQQFILRGEQHGRAKVTDTAVREIRALAASGASQRTLSRRFGLAQTTVGQIIRRESWAHVV